MPHNSPNSYPNHTMFGSLDTQTSPLHYHRIQCTLTITRNVTYLISGDEQNKSYMVRHLIHRKRIQTMENNPRHTWEHGEISKDLCLSVVSASSSHLIINLHEIARLRLLNAYAFPYRSVLSDPLICPVQRFESLFRKDLWKPFQTHYMEGRVTTL